ncbi:hypothetical protein [Pseudanabaena sp. 'Roaring Creek']|uniref:hypothetical protein n=1 Tax=Pseudanabaena sp. 'Roaring Creek' TaxID=1681830 RepID=UPI0006D77FB0|nr:hypothetical protein [Pseudanabaena sp. 'Roaring Creek']
MNISEVLAIVGLFGAAFVWIHKMFDAVDKRFDKRFDKNVNEMNSLNSRFAIFEHGTVEVLEEKINQIKSKQFDLEDKLQQYFESLSKQVQDLFVEIKSK